MKSRTIELPGVEDIVNISGKRVLLRLCLNIPINEQGEIANDFRLTKSLPTLQTLIDKGAKVTIISHIGSDGSQSLAPIEKWLRINCKGDFTLRENLRLDSREKANDGDFARELAQDQDIYVNEDFAVSHRAHTSVVGVPKLLPSYAGFQLAQEVEQLSHFLDPEKPCIVILGGAKLETKMPMINAFLPKADKIFLGSYFASVAMDIPKNPKVILPLDGVSKDGKIMDIGKHALDDILEAVSTAKSIIWNGPMGKFEDGYDATTKELAKAIAKASENENGRGVKSVVGGGDSISAIQSLNLLDKFTFVSTGGGAMLDFLAHGTLPGIDAIINSPH